MFSANQTPSAAQKDTVVNVEATGVFCWNLATYALKDAVNASSEQVEPEVDECVFLPRPVTSPNFHMRLK